MIHQVTNQALQFGGNAVQTVAAAAAPVLVAKGGVVATGVISAITSGAASTAVAAAATAVAPFAAAGAVIWGVAKLLED